MAISRLSGQDCTGLTSNGTTATATFATAATAGNLLVAGALLSTVQANVTIPSGWTKLVGVDLSTVFCTLLCYKVAAGGETGATFSMGGQPNGDVAIGAYEYTGNTASPADVSASNAGGSQVATLATGTTGTTAQADELVFVVAGLSGTVTGPSWASATLLNLVDTKVFTGQRIVSGVATYSDTGSWTNNVFPALVIGTFKAAAVVDGPMMAVLG